MKVKVKLEFKDINYIGYGCLIMKFKFENNWFYYYKRKIADNTIGNSIAGLPDNIFYTQVLNFISDEEKIMNKAKELITEILQNERKYSSDREMAVKITNILKNKKYYEIEIEQ